MAAKKSVKTISMKPLRSNPKNRRISTATQELLKSAPQLVGRALRGAVPIPKELRGEAPEEAQKAKERDEVAAEFERLIRKEYPDRRAPEYIALKQFWGLYRAHYLRCGHRRLARLCLHYFA